MRVVDICCGAGGTSLGFKQAGYEIHAGVDNCTDCCAAYRLNHGCAYALDLLTAEGQGRALELCREADVVVGSPPCQGFSQCNKHRLTQTDAALTLPLVFARLVTQSAPQAFVLEETPLFRHTPQFQAVMAEFQQLFHVEAKVLKAQDYGTPQRRHRLVIVGVRRGLGVRGALHPPPTHVIPVTAGAAFASCCPPPGALLTGKTLRACELRHEMQLRGEQPKSWSGIHSLLCPDTPAPTVTCHVHKPGAYRCMLHGGLFHRLSLEEAACLQGFPAGTHFVGAVNARFRQVGNAVPPPLANAIAMRLRVLLVLGGTSD